MKPATEILLSAAFVLTPEENWTQGSDAKMRGAHVSYNAEQADCWCVDGALKNVWQDCGFSHRDYLDAFQWLAKAVGDYPVDFNDSTQRAHAEVLAALYRAAELSEGGL